MRSDIKAVLLLVAGAAIAACDARPATEGGGGIAPTTGAHTPHVTGTLAEPFDCRQCHDLAFDVTLQGALARANGATPTFNSATQTCSNVYCHVGGPNLVLGGGTVPVPKWDPPSLVGCGACHSLPGDGIPAPWHPAVAENVQCQLCHPGYTNTTVNKAVHVDGIVELQPPTLATSCAACHGDATRELPAGTPAVVLAAPPVDRYGSSDTTSIGVGAHQSHLLPPAGAISLPIACSECHTVPADLKHVGPATNTPASLDWGTLATRGGAQPTFDPSTATCTNYCHGATLTGGTNKQPVWTLVDGTQAACGTCHGLTPTNGIHYEHASSDALGISCGVCHPAGYTPTTVGPNAPIHVNGVTNMNASGFANWSATAQGPNGWRGTATGCHGGTRYWFAGIPGSSCM